MKSKSLAFIFLLLGAQYISCLAFESKGYVEEKGPGHMNGNSYVQEGGVKRDELVLSKASKGKGASGSQNDRPPDTKKSGVSMLLNKPTYMSNVGISVIVINIILIFNF